MKIRQGYALPLTLAAIIVIAMVASIAARQVQASTETITALTEQMRTRVDMASAEQTLLYQTLTEPMTIDGVSVGGQSDITNLILGGETETLPGSVLYTNGLAYKYEGERPTFIRLYDDQSFLNAASTDPNYISDILDLFGVPDNQHARLIATLRDYQDEDDLRSLGGAEADDYELEGLPSNIFLRDALELCMVKYWAATSVCEDQGRLLLTMRARTSDRLSPAQASEPLLDLLLAEEGEAAGRNAYARFATREFTSFSQIDFAHFDQTSDPLSTVMAPGPTLTIISHNADASIARRLVIELTPNSLISPFVVHSKYAIGGDYSQNLLRIESIDDVAPLPSPTHFPPER